MMKNVINARQLSYSYGHLRGLEDVSFSVQQGDFFIIIGPNGSGKTTLLKCISGILRPRTGRLEILGAAVQGYSRKSLARSIALVPQTAPVDFPFTVTEVVLMGRSPHLGILGVEHQQDLERARQAMDFTGVASLAHRRLDQLSGGERQRVMIARAICQEPRIILLDEPTASLDLAHQVRVMDLMERLRHEKKVTILMSSHDINLAALYGNRLMLLKEGHVVSIGPPAEVLTFQTLEAAYGCPLLVDKSPLGNFQRVTLVPQKFIDPAIKAGIRRP
ncbi:MAG: transporter ATP-binding protein [Thermodesulfobacteriota bacterium]|nr:transporter ATP-binding protein [Thermodesulfobacteriota bacterium]